MVEDNIESQGAEKDMLSSEDGSELAQEGEQKKGLFGSKKPKVEKASKIKKEKTPKAPKIKKEKEPKAPKVKKEKTPKAPKVKKEKPPKVQKPKVVKPPKVKKEKAPKVKQEKQPKEKGGKSKKGLVIFLVLIILATAGYGIYHFNLFGVKTMVVDFFISQDTQYQDAVGAKDEYIDRQEAVNKQQQKLAEKNKEIVQKEADIAEREAKLKEDEKAASSSSTGGSSSGTGAQANGEVASGDKAQIVEVYEGMKVEDAARILNATTDNTWIADILKQMDEKKAAKIISALDVEKAVIITRLISETN